MTNDELYKKALAAINVLYNDQSVAREPAIINLKGLRDEIDTLLDALEAQF